jgi:hypothetical protein
MRFSISTNRSTTGNYDAMFKACTHMSWYYTECQNPSQPKATAWLAHDLLKQVGLNLPYVHIFAAPNKDDSYSAVQTHGLSCLLDSFEHEALARLKLESTVH